MYLSVRLWQQLSEEEEEGMLTGVSTAQAGMHVWLASLIKQSFASQGSLETQPSGKGGKQRCICICAYFLHSCSFLSLSMLKTQTCLNPPSHTHTHTLTHTFLRACRHATDPVTIATAVSLDILRWCYTGTHVGGNPVRIRMEEDVTFASFLFALSSLVCLFEMTLTPTESGETLNRSVATGKWSTVSF